MRPALSVIDGFAADVVTLALAADALHTHGGLLSEKWQTRLPDDSCPYTSTIFFWFEKEIPNPKTSRGEARCNFLAAWVYALKRNGREKEGVCHQALPNVPVVDYRARGWTTTFVERGLGDVLIAWENEVLLSLKELAPTSSTPFIQESAFWRSPGQYSGQCWRSQQESAECSKAAGLCGTAPFGGNLYFARCVRPALSRLAQTI